MSKEKESEKTVSNVELLKVQIFAEKCHANLTIKLSFEFGLLLAFSVVLYTLYSEKNFSLVQTGIGFVVLIFFCSIYIVSTVRGYNKELKKISDMIEIVKEGKELPKLEDLRKMSKIMVKEKKEANTTAKKEDEEKPDTKSLIAEYQVLNEAIWRRDQVSLLVNSIMIPATLGIVTFAIRFRSELGRNILFDLPNAGFVPLVSLILILIPYLLWWTSAKLDNICFDRIHEIEGILCIKGHQSVLERIKCNTWYKFRCHMWHFIFLLFLGAYVFTAYWLFRETIIA